MVLENWIKKDKQLPSHCMMYGNYVEELKACIGPDTLGGNGPATITE